MTAPAWGSTGSPVVHIGVGAFHRAHQAMIVDRLRSLTGEPLSIIGIGTRPSDRAVLTALLARGGVYHLVTAETTGELQTALIAAHSRVVDGAAHPDEALEVLTAPTTRVVTLTITEGGYGPGDGEGLDVFGTLAAALDARRRQGVAPFAVLSCDNIRGNGHIARRAVLEAAQRVAPASVEHIAAEVAFPNSMVDRITPVMTPATRATIAHLVGDDPVPVLAESHLQWVIERFAGRDERWSTAGVDWVDDVAVHELAKLRLLNLAHQALAYAGRLRGRATVREAIEDPLVERLTSAVQAEAIATLPDPAPFDLEAYGRRIRERFANPHIGDGLDRICAYTSDRIPQWIVPVVLERSAAGLASRACAMVVATWARYALGVDEQGAPIDVVDQRVGEVVDAARAAESGSGSDFLRFETLRPLADDPVFRADLDRAYADIATAGITGALS